MQKLKSLFVYRACYVPNVVVDSAFCAARRELSEVKLPDFSHSLTVTASVRNDYDPVVKVISAGLSVNEYRTSSRFNYSTNGFECQTAFDHFHNKQKHLVIRFTNAAKPSFPKLSAVLKMAAKSRESQNTEEIYLPYLVTTALERAKSAYAKAFREEITKLPAAAQRSFAICLRGAVDW